MHTPAPTRTATLSCALALWGAGSAWAQPLPSFTELEAAGAKIGEVRIVTRDIFDTDDPKEDKWLFRAANRLHMTTRPAVIEHALLFKTGDALSVRAIDETERLLRGTRYLYDVQFRPLAFHDGVVDIEVQTRDTWTLNPGISAGRSGGSNSSGFKLEEYNLLGTGVAVSLGHARNVDRSGNELAFTSERAFGTWTSLSYSHATNSDGQRDAAAIARPFYALDTRWAAGIKALKDNRIESIYNAGNLVSGYRHRQTQGEVFGGWSAGLIDGWVQRYSLGLSLQDDSFLSEPGLTTPARLPSDRKLVAPFVRYELIEDRFEKERNRNLIGRPEFFALGWASTVQLGWATTALGSSDERLIYSASVSQGFEPVPEHTLITAAKVTGQWASGQVQRQQLGASTQYYLPQGKRWLFYASATADMLTRPDPGNDLLLGGDNGLRGYPLRYQSGQRRALFTVEERFYTDLYVWRLFRVGGAAFFDTGRAWGGDNINRVNPGWLSDVGAGLRIVSARSAFGNVLHVDVAFPLDATADIRKVQLLVKTRTSF